MQTLSPAAQRALARRRTSAAAPAGLTAAADARARRDCEAIRAADEADEIRDRERRRLATRAIHARDRAEARRPRRLV